MIDRIPVPFLNPLFKFLFNREWDGPSTFSILMMIGFLTASYLLPKELKRRKLEPEHSDWLLLLGILGTLVGAKIFLSLKFGIRSL